LDPGHGGEDQGTSFLDTKSKTLLTEKALTLQMALETERQLKLKGYRVTLTRRDDRDLSLPKRTAIANKARGDVFVSLHLNSVQSSTTAHSTAQGVETYILNTATDDTSKRLAHFENTGMSTLQESVDQSTDGLPAEAALILKDLRLSGNLPESKRLACHLQSELVSVFRAGDLPGSGLPKRDRGVRQALFYVLMGADMPGVLVESGFLSSERDRKLLLTPHGIRGIGTALVRAIESFRRQKGTKLAQQTLDSCPVIGQ
jgi:N-acetylmuramoyl-L-alanine amidase